MSRRGALQLAMARKQREQDADGSDGSDNADDNAYDGAAATTAATAAVAVRLHAGRLPHAGGVDVAVARGSAAVIGLVPVAPCIRSARALALDGAASSGECGHGRKRHRVRREANRSRGLSSHCLVPARDWPAMVGFGWIWLGLAGCGLLNLNGFCWI